MDTQIEIHLLPASNDIPAADEKYQAAVRKVAEILKVVPSLMEAKLITASGDVGSSVGIFFFPIPGETVVKEVIKQIGEAARSWAGSMTGQKIKIKVGDVSIEGHAPTIKKLLDSGAIERLLSHERLQNQARALNPARL
jgi:hypothetical protein